MRVPGSCLNDLQWGNMRSITPLAGRSIFVVEDEPLSQATFGNSLKLKVPMCICVGDEIVLSAAVVDFGSNGDGSYRKGGRPKTDEPPAQDMKAPAPNKSWPALGALPPNTWRGRLWEKPSSVWPATVTQTRTT